MKQTIFKNISRTAFYIFALTAHVLNAKPSVYVANLNSNVFSIIDVPTNYVQTGSLGSTNGQYGIAISPDGKTIYIPCSDGMTGTIQLIDVATNTVSGSITLGASIQPNYIAITPNGEFAYVTISSPTKEVLPINLTSMTIGTPIGAGTFTDAQQIVIAPNGLTAYVLDSANDVYPIDLTNNSLQAAVTGSNNPQGIAVSPDSAYLYVSEQGATNIQQYNIAGNANRLTPVTGVSIAYPSFTTFNPQALVISSDGKTLYVSNIGSPIAIGAIDISNPASPNPSPNYADLTGLPAVPNAMAITSDSSALYASSSSGIGSVIAVNTSSPLAPTLTAIIGNILDPQGIVITPTTPPPASVSGCKTKNVFLLQTDYINKITWTAPVNGSPVAYNIYRNAALTDIAGTIPASTLPQYFDHDRNPTIVYTYYITSVDANGNQSAPVSVTVTSPC